MRYKSKQNIRLRSDSEWNFSFSQIKGYLTSTVVTLDLEKNYIFKQSPLKATDHLLRVYKNIYRSNGT